MANVAGYARLAVRIVRGLLFEERTSAADGARRAFTMTCLRLARSDRGDEDAAAQLREAIETNRASAERSAERMAEHRDTYVSDRAYRLLAAMAGSQVPPIRPDLKERFARERELGLMPIDDAFARLVEIVPALGELAHDVERNPAMPMTVYMKRAKSLIDVNEERLRSHIATGLFVVYFRIVGGDASRGDVGASYFRIRDEPMITAYAPRVDCE
jgi:hypothetical protein